MLGWKPLLKALNPQAGRYGRDYEVYARLLVPAKGVFNHRAGRHHQPEKGLSKKLNLIQGVDLATTRTLWLASEYYVRDQIKGKADAPAIRSDAYYEQVAEVYNRVIKETQPNYSPMQRPAILHTQNEFIKKPCDVQEAELPEL